MLVVPMMGPDARLLIVTGFVLLLVGFILPALMVVQILTPSFLLSFISYAASFVGLMLGLVGAMMIVIRRRK